MLANLIYSFVDKAPRTRPARPLYPCPCVRVCVRESVAFVCTYSGSRGPYGIDESVIYKRAYKPQIQFALPKLQLAKHLQCNFRLTAKQATYDYFPALGPEWLLPRSLGNSSSSTGTSTKARPSQCLQRRSNPAERGIRDVFSTAKKLK